VALLYRASGLSNEAAEAQAFLFYCFVFGQSLLFLDRGQRRRAQLIAKSAEKLIIADLARGRMSEHPAAA